MRGPAPLLAVLAAVGVGLTTWALGLFAGAETVRVVSDLGPLLSRYVLMMFAAWVGAASLGADLQNRQLLARPISEPSLVAANALSSMAMIALAAIVCAAVCGLCAALAGAVVVGPAIAVLQQIPGAFLTAACSMFLVVRNPSVLSTTMAFFAGITFSLNDAVMQLAGSGRFGAAGGLVGGLCRMLPALRSPPNVLDQASVTAFGLGVLVLAAIRLRWRNAA
jgi:hypothetical protein